MRRWTEFATVDVEYKDEMYEVGVICYCSESMEGQDADGNRGELMTFCDDIEIVHISPSPPSPEARHYIEEYVYGLDNDDFTWSQVDNDWEAHHEDH